MVIYPKVKFDRYQKPPQKYFMVSLAATRLVSLTCLLSLSTATALILSRPLAAQAQTPPSSNSVEQSAPEQPSPDSSGELRPLSQDGSLLSVKGGQRLMDEANSAVSSQNYDLAVQKLQEARQVFNQLSNFYQELAASFSGIDPRISDVQRQQALKTAEMRDEATYQLALVHRAQNKPELSVPLLIQIIRSQNPTRDLGKKAYQQLYELGFVDSPYPRGQNGASTSSSSSDAPAAAPNR